MELRLRVRNFRVIEALDWSPEGVCLLAGPNGSGKTAVLRAFDFLRTAYLRGISEAVRLTGGARWLRHLRVKDEPVEFEIEGNGICWTLAIPIEGDGIHPFYGERLVHGGQTILDIPVYQGSYSLSGALRQRGDQPEIRTIETIEQPDWLGRFTEQVRSIRVYRYFDIEELQRPTFGEEASKYLHREGRNLVFVLRNWRSAPRDFRGQFEWVLSTVKQAFPGIIEDLEFQSDGSAFFYPAEASTADQKLPLHLAADGLVVALAHLTAVAGAKDGSLVAIDEFENHLHPHAIRTMMKAIRTLAEERDLTIVLTSHSPVVMNTFRAQPEQFYVLKEEEGQFPCSLDQLHDEDWLAQFRPGDLYEGSMIAAPELTKISGGRRLADRYIADGKVRMERSGKREAVALSSIGKASKDRLLRNI